MPIIHTFTLDDVGFLRLTTTDDGEASPMAPTPAAIAPQITDHSNGERCREGITMSDQAEVTELGAVVDPRKMLAWYTARYATQAAAAKSLGVSRAFLGQCLHGKVPIPTRLLTRLGLRRAVVRVAPENKCDF
jgi:hypothetical protein